MEAAIGSADDAPLQANWNQLRVSACGRNAIFLRPDSLGRNADGICTDLERRWWERALGHRR